VKIWDYQTRSCLYTFDQPGSQTENISCVIFHPDLPIIISGSEDDTVNIYDHTTYKLISQLQYGLKRVWSISATPDSNTIAFGFDEGTIVVKMGKDLPLASFVNGKVVQIKAKEI
jgi:coatomer subunit beta'